MKMFSFTLISILLLISLIDSTCVPEKREVQYLVSADFPNITYSTDHLNKSSAAFAQVQGIIDEVN